MGVADPWKASVARISLCFQARFPVFPSVGVFLRRSCPSVSPLVTRHLTSLLPTSPRSLDLTPDTGPVGPPVSHHRFPAPRPASVLPNKGENTAVSSVCCRVSWSESFLCGFFSCRLLCFSQSQACAQRKDILSGLFCFNRVGDGL